MNEFNPGPGWKPADSSGDLRDVERLMLVDKSNTRVAAWVRQAPVPPLPTEDGWYIELTTGLVWRLHDVDGWIPANGLRVERAQPIPSVRRLR